MDMKYLVSAGPGYVALIISIYSVWRARRADQVVIKVIPKLYWQVGGQLLLVGDTPRLKELVERYGRPGVAIEVTNLSKFPVTVDDVGFCMLAPSIGERAALPNPLRDDNVTWPTRLESRSSATYRAHLNAKLAINPFLASAYAKTECGHEAVGSNFLFSELAILDDLST